MPPVFWTQRMHFGPAPRMDHAMAYDAARERAVLFGGVNAGGTFADTWTWDGVYWTQVSDTGPQARCSHAMAYDSARRQVVLFGGSVGGATRLEDTWVWDGAGWTQVAETGPPPRRAHAMAWDDARSLVVLFGGEARDGELQDTWEWDGGNWTQREENGPPSRSGHTLAYNAATASLVLFGGTSQGKVLNDTWNWNGTLWRQVSEFGAPALQDAAMTGNARGTVLFGGVGAAPAELARDETWEWDGRFWTEIQHFGPPARAVHAMVFDTARRRVVLFGGIRQSGPPSVDSLLGDTWESPAREPVLASLSVTPPDVHQGGRLVVAVKLTGSTSDDLTVQLVSSSAGMPVDLGLASTITVTTGQSAAAVTSTVSLAAPIGNYTITATTGGVRLSTSLTISQAVPGTLRIAAVLPDPVGDELQDEAVHLRNDSATPVILAGWRIANGKGLDWGLDIVDGVVAPGQTIIITRQGRPMPLTNSGGTLVLLNPARETIDTRTYGPVIPGQLVQFE